MNPIGAQKERESEDELIESGHRVEKVRVEILVVMKEGGAGAGRADTENSLMEIQTGSSNKSAQKNVA